MKMKAGEERLSLPLSFASFLSISDLSKTATSSNSTRHKKEEGNSERRCGGAWVDITLFHNKSSKSKPFMNSGSTHPFVHTFFTANNLLRELQG